MRCESSFYVFEGRMSEERTDKAEGAGERKKRRPQCGEMEANNKRPRDRVQIRARVKLQQAESNQLAHSRRETWHSSPNKGDSTINSINPISIPSSSPRWVNTHLHHTAKLLLPSSLCKGSVEQWRVRGWMEEKEPRRWHFSCSGSGL